MILLQFSYGHFISVNFRTYYFSIATNVQQPQLFTATLHCSRHLSVEARKACTLPVHLVQVHFSGTHTICAYWLLPIGRLANQYCRYR